MPVLQCYSSSSEQVKSQGLANFKTKLKSLHATPTIQEGLIRILNFTLLRQPSELNTLQPDIRGLVLKQLVLSEMSLISGIVLSEWAVLQDKLFNQYQKWRNDATWIQTIVNELWTLAYSIWEHWNTILCKKN